MLRLIFAFFGFSKIPIESVKLSMMQENYLQKLLNNETNTEKKDLLLQLINGQKALTGFLRSGRLF